MSRDAGRGRSGGHAAPPSSSRRRAPSDSPHRSTGVLPRASAAASLAILLAGIWFLAVRADRSGDTSLAIEQAGRPAPTPVSRARVVNTYPHDRDAFTQGLQYENGALYEGTGLLGRSRLRKVQLETGRVLQEIAIPAEHFGEGIVVWKDRIFQLTWRSRVGFVYERDSFRLLRTLSYPGEGWGLTHDGRRLIMSDGSATLFFRDPDTFKEIGRLAVHDRGQPVPNLNELEYVRGEIYANVWQTDRIARISPDTGAVTGWIDLAGLLQPEDYAPEIDVLNGIAYDTKGDRLFVTGKHWPKLFEIKMAGRM
jgi:glutamine cyclotransferase